MRKHTFIHANNLKNKEITKDDLYEGERISYKCEDIKYEDE
jgi:hypothetical protein